MRIKNRVFKKFEILKKILKELMIQYSIQIQDSIKKHWVGELE